MSKEVADMARKYYPALWNNARLRQLVEATPQRLTPAEYQSITGGAYAPPARK